MIDELSLYFQHTRVPDPFWDKGSRWTRSPVSFLPAATTTVVVLVRFGGFGLLASPYTRAVRRLGFTCWSCPTTERVPFPHRIAATTMKPRTKHTISVRAPGHSERL